jgi:hypothetical protein
MLCNLAAALEERAGLEEHLLSPNIFPSPDGREQDFL